MAHELGHLWGIGDLYTNPKNANLENIYANTYRFQQSARHDKNAMYICLDRPLYEDAAGRLSYRNSPGTLARNEWKTVFGRTYYFGSNTYALNSGWRLAGNTWNFFAPNGQKVNSTQVSLGSAKGSAKRMAIPGDSVAPTKELPLFSGDMLLEMTKNGEYQNLHLEYGFLSLS